MLKPIIDRKNLIPTHQFGFRDHHSTIDQVHRIVNFVENTMDKENVCSAAFLDVSQALEKVWFSGLLLKLKCMLPKQYCEIIASYLKDRYFRNKQEDAS